MNLVVRQRLKVLWRSVERLNIGKCWYVVTGLASQENQWEWGLSRISEVTIDAPGHYWHSCYFCFLESYINILLWKWKFPKLITIWRWRAFQVCKLMNTASLVLYSSVWELIKSRLDPCCLCPWWNSMVNCRYAHARTHIYTGWWWFFITLLTVSRHIVPLSHIWHLIGSFSFMVCNKYHLKQLLKSWQTEASLVFCPFKLSTS